MIKAYTPDVNPPYETFASWAVKKRFYIWYGAGSARRLAVVQSSPASTKRMDKASSEQLRMLIAVIFHARMIEQNI